MAVWTRVEEKKILGIGWCAQMSDLYTFRCDMVPETLDNPYENAIPVNSCLFYTDPSVQSNRSPWITSDDGQGFDT